MSLSVAELQSDALYRKLWQVRARALQPPPKLTLSQWTEQFMVLSPEASSLAGKFRFDRAPFQREVWDALTDDAYKKVVLMCSSQIMKTQALLCYLGFIIHSDPGPILVVQPSIKNAQTFSKDRVDTMLRDVTVLKGRVKEKRQRDGGNTTMHKIFPAGHLTIGTANSPSDLASRPIRYLLCDEVDRYGPTAEGDPVALARARTTTFWNAKEVLVSSPGDEATSRINPEYQASDRRVFMVPCNGCGAYQQLVWAQVKWEEGKPYTARYECASCGLHWHDQQKNVNVSHGYWHKTNPESTVAGFHISNIYNSFKTLEDLVDGWLASKTDQEQLKAFVNTQLAETWKTDATSVGEINFLNRLENYTPASVPNAVALITAGVDVQIDRLEVEVCGWGVGDESWSLEYQVIHGDPNSPAPWDQLEQLLNKVYTRADGLQMRINATCIDTGGTATQDVFNFARKHGSKNVFPIKGVAGPGKLIFPKKYKRWKTGARFYPLGVDTAKERLYAQLKIVDDGPGKCHFPATYDEFYFNGLTAEKYVVKYKKGVAYRVWFKKDSERNEPLDCRVYAMAARASINIDMKARLATLGTKAEEQAKSGKTPDQITPVEPVLSPLAEANKPPTLAKKPIRRPIAGQGYISSLTRR